MQVLKHIKNGRLFIATPMLLRNAKLQAASTHEADAFIAKMSNKLRLETEEHHTTTSVVIPDDLDLDIDLSRWGKEDLLMLANRIKLGGTSGLKVKDLKVMLINILDGAKELRDSDEESEDNILSDTLVGGGEVVDFSNGVVIPDEFNRDIDLSVMGKVDLLAIATAINMTGVSRVKVDELREALIKVFSDAKSEQGE